MIPDWRVLTVVAFAAFGAGPAVAQDAAPGGPVGGSPPSAAVEGDVLAQGAGGALTRDAAEAYIEALEFTLAEIGQPTIFGAGERGQIHDALTAGFADLPVEVQVDLVNARLLWRQFRSEWGTLPPEAKQEFAYHILAPAYCEQAARQALGLNTDAGERGGAGDGPTVDDMLGNVPGTTDCWGSAGCTGYDPGTGTYTFESYE